MSVLSDPEIGKIALLGFFVCAAVGIALAAGKVLGFYSGSWMSTLWPVAFCVLTVGGIVMLDLILRWAL